MTKRDIYFWLAGQENNIYLETVQRGKEYRLKWYTMNSALSRCLFYGLSTVFHLEFPENNTCTIKPR